MLAKFRRQMDPQTREPRTEQEDIEMHKTIKRELKRHSFLNNSKTASTVDQLIKMIELNGGVLSNAGSTPDYDHDNARRERHCQYLMFYARQF